MTEQYLYPVYETDAWHSTSNRDCKGIYTSKEEAVEAIAEHHNIPLDEFDGLTEIWENWLKVFRKRCSQSKYEARPTKTW